jgi:hypothetical protein
MQEFARARILAIAAKNRAVASRLKVEYEILQAEGQTRGSWDLPLVSDG